MAKRKRNGLLTPTVADSICGYLAEGVTRECAADMAGIAPRTLAYWLARGDAAMRAAEHVARDLDDDARAKPNALAKLVERADRPYVRLLRDVLRAESQAEVLHTRKIANASDWKSSAWWLERRRRSQYGQHSTLTVERPPAECTTEELIAELRELGFVQATVVEAPESAATGQQGHSPTGLPDGSRASSHHGDNDHATYAE